MVQIVVSRAGAGGLEEWVLVELQGEIQARRSTGLAGNLLGDLHYTSEVRGSSSSCRGVLPPSGGRPGARPRGPLTPCLPSLPARGSPCSSWVTTSCTGRPCAWRSPSPS
uniref:Chromosome transmission fidelity factor 8 n=1 Tax=Crocodylus porosus TaxID=8502 RepID=A0A7M4EM58_CROPO